MPPIVKHGQLISIVFIAKQNTKKIETHFEEIFLKILIVFRLSENKWFILKLREEVNHFGS